MSATTTRCPHLRARVADELGRVDILVNNAGGGFAAPFLDVSNKGQDALIRENFSSAASFIRAAAPGLAPRDRHRERHLDRGAPGRPGLCRLLRDEGGAGQPRRASPSSSATAASG